MASPILEISKRRNRRIQNLLFAFFPNNEAIKQYEEPLSKSVLKGNVSEVAKMIETLTNIELLYLTEKIEVALATGTNRFQVIANTYERKLTVKHLQDDEVTWHQIFPDNFDLPDFISGAHRAVAYDAILGMLHGDFDTIAEYLKSDYPYIDKGCRDTLAEFLDGSSSLGYSLQLVKSPDFPGNTNVPLDKIKLASKQRQTFLRFRELRDNGLTYEGAVTQMKQEGVGSQSTIRKHISITRKSIKAVFKKLGQEPPSDL